MPEVFSREFPPHHLNLLPQSAVRSSVFPSTVPQNSIWDFIHTPEGRIFVSLCGEGTVSASGQLHEYMPEDGRFRLCFDLSKVCLVGSRAIPPSKIHSSMSVLRDGRLIMATHNTAPAPGHPRWMFDAYYSHIWEGFAGAHLLIYDPATDEVKNLGIPVPRESVYGGIYDARHHAYYFIGYVRGHLYRYDLDSAEVTDMGQVSEFGSFRVALGPDGNIYGGTRTGWLYKVDVDRRRVVELGVQLPPRPDYPSRVQFASAAIGPDGRLYMANHMSDLFAALDVKTGRLEVVGSGDPEIIRQNYPRCPNGLAFDDDGVLWYSLNGCVGGFMGVWSHLARWDVTRGGKPEVLGLLGTVKRSVWFSSEAILHKNMLYVTDTNHLEDPPAVIRVDLEALKRDKDKPREKTRDPMAYGVFADADAVYPGTAEDLEPFREQVRRGESDGDFGRENTYTIQSEATEVFRLWQSVPVAESSVRKIQWLDNGRLQGVCESRDLRGFVCTVGGGVQLLDTAESKAADASIPAPSGLAALPASLAGLRLPHRQGRQYLAQASCCAPWHDGQWLVGTRDGMLARIDPKAGAAFALGSVAVNGPVHQIVTNAAGTVAYGVAGDPSDLGFCFRFDDTHGVWELGRTMSFEGTPHGLSCSCQPCCVALSPDETCLAIGVADRLGTVYVYHNVKTPWLRPG